MEVFLYTYFTFEVFDCVDVSRISRLPNGQYVFHAIYDEVTSQLGSLVLGQKDSEKQMRDMRRMQFSFKRNTRPSPPPLPVTVPSTCGGLGAFGTKRTLTPAAIAAVTSFSRLRLSPIRANPTTFVPANIQKNISIVLKNAVNNRLRIDDFQIGLDCFLFFSCF